MGVTEGSLSKEFPLEQMEAAILLAREGMSRGVFRGLAGKIHPDISALVINRFLFLKEDKIRRDKFLALCES